MSSSPALRSQHSISTTNSQQSIHHENFPTEKLVTHLLASKKSLSSINSVWRANQIVTSARTALEESVVVGARTGFLRHGILDQIKILRKVRGGIDDVYKDGQSDFKNVIRALDAANTRLESTMDILRSTMVEAGFRPTGEEPRSLLDFVDEHSVEVMRDALKTSIRESRETQTEFDSTILAFDNDLRSLKGAMTASMKRTSSQSRGNHVLPIPELLQALEEHAHESASLLESLTSHFDLCVNAIRHTDGGYAAVRKAASNPPPGAESVSVSWVMTSSSEQAHELEPISDEERSEMLRVLEKDASEVEDVVMEIRDRLADMESKHESISEHLDSLKNGYRETIAAYTLLENIGARLSGYFVMGQDFHFRWEDTKAQILEQMDELESIRVFYENYYACYDNLILEVARRKQAEDKIKTIVKKATEQIEKIAKADKKERDGFRVDVGDYLPVDLYPDVNAGMKNWVRGLSDIDMRCSENGGEVKAVANESVPELAKGVVEAASTRNQERQRVEKM